MSSWPELPYAEWAETKNTLNRWMQVVGKIQLELTPKVNHWWNVAFHLTARGLATGIIPLPDGWFDIEFDFIDHQLRIRTSDGRKKKVPLAPHSVADVYGEIFEALESLAIECRIWPVPVEMEDTMRLDTDEEHHAYDPDAVSRFLKILGLTHNVFSTFRGEFIGKCSPVHFFWGSFDLAVTRFSGRTAPAREGADPITREAYSHEVSSVGFWPGDSRLPLPSFYSYAAPEPKGFRSASVEPAAAYYNEKLGGFYLHYDEMRKAPRPEEMLLEFCRTTYEAAAVAGQWDRVSLERRS